VEVLRRSIHRQRIIAGNCLLPAPHPRAALEPTRPGEFFERAADRGAALLIGRPGRDRKEYAALLSVAWMKRAGFHATGRRAYKHKNERGIRHEIQPPIYSVIAGLAGSLLCARAGAQSCAVNVPHITGTWVVLPYQMPINPISATMLPTGKVLLVAGSENDATNNSKGAESYRAVVLDPTGTTESSIAVKNLNYDVFCSGTAALPDGRSLI